MAQHPAFFSPWQEAPMIGQTMRVLRLFGPQRRELGVTEAAALLDRPKSSVSRLLRTMEAEGFLARDPDTGRFRLSLGLAALGEVARASTSMQRLARPVLEELVESTGETSNLVVLDGTEAVNVEVVRSSRAVHHVGVLGRRLPLHATAAGKVLLAWASTPGVLDRVLCGPLPRLASRTLTSRGALEAELARVREQGHALAWAELEEELAAASAPVRDHRGAVVAAITTSAPISRLNETTRPALARKVMAAAGRLSDALGHRPG
ncbi:MAG: IclR family transcriptional regulator [Gemmatimonadales bacterium]|nr:MAG: IclR family transcriptional regulator [Gemmatimonadales bacterium]